MRAEDGYSGPVAHWWASNLLYGGPMADWRYEGIICGYLELYRSSGAKLWLERAIEAGDDLVLAQLPSGMYLNSSFEHGPMEGGTPHEAAADIGLLELAQTLRLAGDSNWMNYANTARRNIEEYHLRQLWNGDGFRDQPWNNTLVPNKNATIIEALLMYEATFGEEMSKYIEPAARVVLSSQEKTGPRAGCTVHHGTGRHRLGIGIYTARSVCGILRLYTRRPCDELLAWVQRAVTFLERLCTQDTVYFGRYYDGSLIANPRLIAGAGDLLRAFVLGSRFGLETDVPLNRVLDWLLAGQTLSGGIMTAAGFRWRGGRAFRDGLPDFRDLLPVVGWCDKAFRALAMISPSLDGKQSPSLGQVQADCIWKRRQCTFQEDQESFTLTDSHTGEAIYRWKKGNLYPEIYSL